jgi:aspartokinase/homoserine dehydrogenase 1
MPLTVHKFGGASLADTAAVRRAVGIFADQPDPKIAVVSAFAGVTDQLLAGAVAASRGSDDALHRVITALGSRYAEMVRGSIRKPAFRRSLLAQSGRELRELEALARGLAVLRELTPRTSDYILAVGERLSARLFATALNDSGVKSSFIEATEIIRTDAHFGGASPELAATDRAVRTKIRPFLSRRVAPVVPGFIGSASDGQVTTLGRGGSDLTATLIARSLRASSVTLWKDVAGLLTADPRIVADAHVIPQLHPREAAELAYYGARVLHPRALIPLGDRPIPILVRPFADPSAPGTEVSARRTLRKHPVKAVSSITEQALVTVTGNGMLGVPGIAARTFGALQREGVSVSLISQASSEHSICFSVPNSSAEKARQALRSAFGDEIAHREIDGVEVRTGMATLAVVGLGMSGAPGIAARVFDALASGGINVVAIAQGSSELNISVVVEQRDAMAATRRIHGAFQLNRIGGGRVVRTRHADVILLGFGQIGQSLARMIPRGGRERGKLRVVAAIDRGGYVFHAGGLPPRRLAELVAAKRRGAGLATLAGGRASPPEEAVREIVRHALVEPILVDVTADDTLPALRLALSSGMNLVLANKRPLAGPVADARGLMELAAAQGRRILHETTVGAGLPIIDTFHKLVESGDRVLRIDGCTSGTLGFLLDEIGRGRPFSRALARAMELGYTEPDPRDDLSGLDVARKALILARLLGYEGELEDIAVESLVPDEARGLSRAAFLRRLATYDDAWAERVAKAREAGGVLRYLATITRRRVRVGLRAVSATSPFAGLTGTDNQVAFTTTRYRANPLVITGPGAGPAVTAAGVLNDLLKLAAA